MNQRTSICPRLKFLASSRLLSTAFSLICTLVILLPEPGWSASQNGMPAHQMGPSSGRGSGGWLSTPPNIMGGTNTGGLGTYTAYFIEVPPSAPRLVVDIFDADVGTPGETALDWQRTNPYSNTIRYQLFNPGGGAVVNVVCAPGSPPPAVCVNGAWATLFDSGGNPADGHWELRITMEDPGGADDTSGHGIRAHDGNTDSSGVELNTYAESYFHPGYSFRDNLDQSSTVHDYYPFVSGGCDFFVADFDSDTQQSTVSVDLATVNGTAFSDTVVDGNMSASDVWASNTITGFTAPQLSDGYGVWNSQFNIAPGSTLNWTTMYVGSYQSAAPTVGNPAVAVPTAQPEAGSIRTYLPTDPASNPDDNATRGGTPLKPFMEQQLQYVAGPNPPVVGLTTTMAVQIIIENPTPHPLNAVVRGGDVVQSFIPGGDVVYAGNAFISQGSLSGQPAVGGSGNITWQPGTLAANSRAGLTYQIDVTPTALATDINVTGTPGGNGTTWTYLDETANTSQARATYDFGELCQLSINTLELIITYATVNNVDGLVVDGIPTVAWETGTEVGTVGFVVERLGDLGYESVGEVRAPGDSPGASYRLADPTARSGETHQYRLVERQINGSPRHHGPFTVTFNTPAAPAPARQPNTLPATQLDRLAGLDRGVAPAPAATTDHLKLGIQETGLYRLSASTIADQTRHDQVAVLEALASGNLHLSTDGEPVAWTVTDDGTGLWFLGEGPEGQFHAQRVYWLTVGEIGPTMVEMDASPRNRGLTSESFAALDKFSEDQRPLLSLPTGPEDNYWYWATLVADDPTLGSQNFNLPLDNPLTDAGQLRLQLRGLTDTLGIAPDHRVVVSLNGTELGDFAWNGNAPREAIFEIPRGLLLAGDNTLGLTALATDGDSIFLLDSASLDHHRQARLVDGELLIGNPDPPPALIMASGFGDPQPQPDILVTGVDAAALVLAMDDPRQPMRLNGATLDGDSLRFAPRGAQHWVSTRERAPLWVQPADPGLASDPGGAEYLVIAPESLDSAAQRLADYRRQGGLSARVVSLEAIADGYGHGQSDPQAIGDFLADAVARWSPALRFVVLAGNGSFDYRNLQGYGDNLLPPQMVATPKGLFASDGSLVDLNGNRLANLPIGRIPALDNGELDGYIDKLMAFEAGPSNRVQQQLLLADDREGGLDFAQDSQDLVDGLGLSVEHLGLDTTPIAGARDRLFQALDEGVGWVNFFGHGSSDRLAREQWLTLSDVDGLSNTMTPVVTALTCLSNFFELPGFATLGEALVLHPDGGAVAVIAPTGLAYHPEALRLGQSLYRAVFLNGEDVLGEAFVQALEENAGHLENSGPLFTLFGDPALKLR